MSADDIELAAFRQSDAPHPWAGPCVGVGCAECAKIVRRLRWHNTKHVLGIFAIWGAYFVIGYIAQHFVWKYW